MHFIKNLKEVAKSDVAIAGGKGASLGEMTKTGISVPRGFVILSRAFQNFIQETGLQVEIDAAFDTINPEEMHTLENASEKIQAGIIDGEIPLYIKKEIEDSFKRLKCKFVAVRSSATAEDSMGAAWAGQLNSYLNTTQRDLLEHIKKCWASLFTPRALFYRFEKNLQDRRISVAVIIQEMINSEKSGIGFSVHPVTQDKNQLIIEAGFGLGEAIVSGQITPDSYVVDKRDWHIIDINVNEQTKGLFRKSNGGNGWKELGQKGKKRVLKEKEIVKLAKLIAKIEEHYGFPVDVEWAYEKSNFYIVQSRPITTLMKKDKSTENKFELEFRGEGRDAFLENEGISLSDIKKHTLADRFMEKMEGQELSPPMYNSTLFVQTSGWNVKKYFQKYYSDRTSFPLLITMNADEGIMYIPATKMKKLSEEIFKKYWADESIITEIFKEYRTKTKTIDKIYGQITHDFLEKNNFEELVPYAELIKDAAWDMNAVVFFSIFFDKEMCSDLLKRVKSKISQERLNDLWDKAIDPIFDSFEKRREYYLLNLLKRSLSLDEISEKCQYFYANYSEIFSIKEVRKKIKKKLTKFENRRRLERFLIKEQEKKNKIIKKHNLWIKALSPEEKKLVHYLQLIMELRDDRKDYLAKLLVVVFKIAEKLFDDGGLDKRLIYFSMFDEIVKGDGYLIKNKGLLEKRINGCSVLVDYGGEKYIEYGNFDETKEKLEKFFLNQQKIGNCVIKGNPAYPGKVRGVVKIITNLAIQSRDFKKGGILVTGMTRPEFVPLMKKACAVITDEGGVTSHAAIVSREMKIPCVIGTKIATSVLKDGMLIEVDAHTGVVRVVDKENLDIGKFDDYQRMFQLGGMPYLGNENFMEHYKTLHVLTFFDKGIWISYLPKKIMERTLKEGVNIYCNTRAFKNYYKEFETYKKETEKLFNHLVKKKLAKEEVSAFLKQCSEFFRLYSKTEFFYTDSVFSKSLDDKKRKELLQRVECCKNPGREFLNRMFMGKDAYFMQILSKVGKQFNVSAFDLMSYDKREIIELFDNKKVDPLIIKMRQESYLSKGDGREVSYKFGDDAQGLIEHFKSSEYHGKNILRGIVANKGRAKGRAMVIPYSLTHYDNLGKLIDKMEKGQVLVAETTSPEFMPACKKASAILTNQGGLMSHAAIVSRELGIPCIVALGDATEIIKNHDELEVDADRGIVRIIKR